jgi:hypothetical protein
MNLPANISQASLPETYQAAQRALSECSQIDECKDWADKAAALASYARQSEDDELERMAQRIRARAIQRAGELLKQFDARPQNAAKQKEGDRPLISQQQMARDAGMSDHQRKQAVRIASISREDFEAQVDGDKPPTISQLAAQGIKPRQNIVDLKGRDPAEFNRALHYIADFEEAAKELARLNHDLILPTLTETERDRLRAAIRQIDATTDKVATRI